MIPYGDFYYFYIMVLVLIPAIIIGLCEKKIKYYGMIATAFMIYIIFGKSEKEFIFLAAYYLIQIFCIYLYIFVSKKFHERFLLWIMISISILPLVIVKVRSALNLGAVGFLGISYLTFKSVQVLIQIYDGHIKSMNLFDFTYFLLFFPTISSGPIDRSKRFFKDINSKIKRSEYIELLGKGIWKIVLGIGYKFIIAYFINEKIIKEIPVHPHSMINIVSYMYSYSFYMFFDFAGYSLIAVGVSYVLGIVTPENFNKPFISKDIKQFWNRWHMSLSFWFRDFIYTRFVMAALKKKWFKSRYTASYIGFMITMIVMGFWHGIEPHYIIYGFYHGILIVATDMLERKKFYRKMKNNNAWNMLSTFITFNLVCFSFLIFSGYLFK